MTEFSSKLRCESCEWVFTDEMALVGKNPFDNNLTIYGCPNCKDIENFIVLCDVVGCYAAGTCGSPVGEEYHNLCGKHFRELRIPS